MGIRPLNGCESEYAGLARQGGRECAGDGSIRQQLSRRVASGPGKMERGKGFRNALEGFSFGNDPKIRSERAKDKTALAFEHAEAPGRALLQRNPPPLQKKTVTGGGLVKEGRGMAECRLDHVGYLREGLPRAGDGKDGLEAGQAIETHVPGR